MGRCGHGEDAQVRILHGAQLSLQQHGLAVLQRLVEEAHRVAHIGPDQLPALQQLAVQRLRIQGGLVVQVLKQDVFQLHRPAEPLPEPVFVKEVAYLNARLGVFIRVKGGDAALGGAEGLPPQPLLLIPVLKDVVGHEQLGPLGHDEAGGGHAPAGHVLKFRRQLGHVQRHPVPDDIGNMGIEGARGQDVQGETPVVVDDGVARVGPPLEAHHHVGSLRQQVGDFTLALVAPVGPYNRFYHFKYLCGRDSQPAPGWSALSVRRFHYNRLHAGPQALFAVFPFFSLLP